MLNFKNWPEFHFLHDVSGRLEDDWNISVHANVLSASVLNQQSSEAAAVCWACNILKAPTMTGSLNSYAY